MLFLSFLVVAFAYLHIAGALTGLQIVQDLQASLSPGSEVILTSNSSYTADFTPRFTISEPPTYVVGVKPVLVTDVQKVVQYALLHHVPFLATGGGHGYTWTLNRLQGGIDLDLGNFDTIDIDTAANTMKIGGSVRSENVTTALQAAGKEMPVGMCICVGFAGFTLGGGIGPYSGLYGAASDSLVSVEMVTGRGEILTVSATSYPDLFYGLKGAGFNYGVVTSLTYRVYPATNGGQAVVANMMFPGYQNGSVWSVLATFFGSQAQPRELGITLSIGYDAALGGTVLIAGFVYAGPQADATALLQPFLDLAPLNLDVSTVAWEDVPRAIVYGATLQGCDPGVYFVPYSANLYEIDVANLVDVVNFMNDSMAADATLQNAILSWTQYSAYGFQLYGDAASAFPYRDATVFVQFDGFGDDAAQVPALNDFGAQLRSRLQQGSGRSDLEVYVNFAHGDEAPASCYSERKLPGLMSLKAEYDPSSLFSWYNPL